MADRLASVLETYRGREKIMRLLQYASFLASGGLHKVSCEVTGEKFRIFAEAMSECRTVLRLFDDAAMISFAQSYGTGKEVIKRKRGKRERYQLLCLRQQQDQRNRRIRSEPKIIFAFFEKLTILFQQLRFFCYSVLIHRITTNSS